MGDETLQTLLRLRKRILGYQASNNVYRVIDDEILKLDPEFETHGTKRRRKEVVERNELVEQLQADLARHKEAVRFLEKALGDVLDYWHLGDSDETNALMLAEQARAEAKKIVGGGKP